MELPISDYFTQDELEELVHIVSLYREQNDDLPQAEWGKLRALQDKLNDLVE